MNCLQIVSQSKTKVREAVAESSLLDLTDDKGRRILVPGERLGYVDLGSPSARAVGFGAV